MIEIAIDIMKIPFKSFATIRIGQITLKIIIR